MRIENLRKSEKSGLLDGQMLVAMPGMPDPRFAGTVIYICAHSEEGAMGLVVNRRASTLALPELLVQLDVVASTQAIRLPERAGRMAVLSGGPVETSRGFVLHSTDYVIEDSTLPISDTVGLTITIDILRAIARGEGPDSALLALGYAGWGPGQLEQEMQVNTWLHAPPDHDILFGHEFDRKYDRALRKLGIDPAFLSQEAGHA